MTDIPQQRSLLMSDTIDVRSLIANPRSYLEGLDDRGELATLFPAFSRTKGVGQSPIRHAEGGVFVHTLMTLDAISKESPSDKAFGRLEDQRSLMLVIFALMYHDTGKRERNLNEVPGGPRVDHVKVSMDHARNDLAAHLHPEDLEIVIQMIRKHESLPSEHVSHKVNKLHKLFAVDGTLASGRALLKFVECDMLGRKVADGHEHIWDENMAFLERNVELYKILLELSEGAEFPLQIVRSETTRRIKQLLGRD